jgi:DNA-damage-inducible protein D
MKNLAVFQGKEIRKTWHNEEWWFSVVDVVQALTEQTDYQKSRKYWNKLSERLRNEGFQPVTNCHQFKLKAQDGKQRLTDCANTEGIFRIIQSIPSKKAEPFKLWLAKTGYERVQEIENPELAQKRMKQIYKEKGYSDAWIEKRIRGIEIRDELTDEWKKRDIKTEKEYSILTAEIAKATFNLTPKEHKDVKGLQKENLRDHMSNLELVFSMLGESVSTEITKNENAQGYKQAENAAKRGGKVAGDARKHTERELGHSIISTENYLEEPEKKKKLSQQ